MGQTPQGTPQGNSPARRAAYTMIFIWMIGAGFAASFTIGGRPQTGLLVCGASFLISIVVLVVGGLLVASSPEDEEG